MSVFIGVVAWMIIAFVAMPIVITLVYLEAGLHAGKQRHGRAVTMGEAWPDIRSFLPCVAIGVSLLGRQWSTDTAGWWLMHIPVLAAWAVLLEVGIRYLIRRKSGGPTAEPS